MRPASAFIIRRHFSADAACRRLPPAFRRQLIFYATLQIAAACQRYATYILLLKLLQMAELAFRLARFIVFFISSFSPLSLASQQKLRRFHCVSPEVSYSFISLHYSRIQLSFSPRRFFDIAAYFCFHYLFSSLFT